MLGQLGQMGVSMWFFCIALAGAAFLSLSLIFGHDHEVGEHDLDHDHDHDHGGEGQGNLSIFSFKVMNMFVTGFGAGGFMAARVGYGVVGSSVAGILLGFFMGLLGYLLMNFLYHRQGNSVVKTSSLIGSDGLVTTTIAHLGVGEVRCAVDGHSEYFPARSRNSEEISLNSTVKVVGGDATLLLVEKA